MTRSVVQKPLPSVARPALLRHIGPQASSKKWPGLPRPLPLGEVARRRRDGEGKPVTAKPLRSGKQSLCQSDTIAVQELFSSVLALSGAPRQLSQRESHWHVGQLSSGRAKPDITQKIVPCYRGQQLRNHVPCQAAASLGSRALLFAIQIKFYSSSMGLTDTPVPLPSGATATTAASGGNREELLGPRPAGCERQRSRRWEPQPGQCHRR